MKTVYLKIKIKKRYCFLWFKNTYGKYENNIKGIAWIRTF